MRDESQRATVAQLLRQTSFHFCSFMDRNISGLEQSGTPLSATLFELRHHTRGEIVHSVDITGIHEPNEYSIRS